MYKAIVECIANFSEARRPEIVEEIVAAITGVTGVHLLDRHSDLDHNRTVLSFAGPPEAVEEAAFRSIARAAELINLDEHTGEHPRIGATDVVPFVPISGLTMQDCVQIARRLGERVGEELAIPVYLYEEAATRPERKNLEDIRRGEYEALKTEIGTHPERAPDYGPTRLGTAGATVIGARQPLIAFNVYLNSEDVTIAKKIARAVRHSTGGLRYVKALGMLVEGRAQISMNLTDFHKTPLARVVELIRSEAARYGVAVYQSELVGLIPQEALVDAAVWYLQMDRFEPGQVLEQQLYSAMQEASNELVPTEGRVSSQDFLDALAAATPTPGGGSAGAFAGAAAAALVAMVARLTIGKKKYVDVQARMETILERAEELRAALTAAVEQDATSFEQVMAAYRLPKDTPEQQAVRAEAIEGATLEAARVPLGVVRQAVEVLKLAAQVVAHGNINAISDGGTAAALARAALAGGGLNVRINSSALRDASAAQSLLDELYDLEQLAVDVEKEVRSTLLERGGFTLA